MMIPEPQLMITAGPVMGGIPQQYGGQQYGGAPGYPPQQNMPYQGYGM